MPNIFYIIQFRFANGEPRSRNISDFSWEKSPFSKKFRRAKTVKEFAEIWDKEVAPYLNSETGAFTPTANTGGLRSQSRATSGVTCITSGQLNSSATSACQGQLTAVGSAMSTTKRRASSTTSVFPATKKRKEDLDARIEECYSG